MKKYQIGILFLVFATALATTVAMNRTYLQAWYYTKLKPAEKVWIWCPQNTETLTVLPKKTVIDNPQSIINLCNAQLDHVITDVKSTEFTPALLARSSSGQVAMLEYNETENLFRADGITFYSYLLSHQFKSSR